MDTDLTQRAAALAAAAHAGQTRKYGGAPYITHPARVAARVAALPNATAEMVAAAWLHDVVEDCGVAQTDVVAQFGADVARLVDGLTDRPKQPGINRAARQAAECARLAAEPEVVRLLKLCDRADNLAEMVHAPDKFRQLYARETRALVAALAGTCLNLEAEVLRLCDAL